MKKINARLKEIFANKFLVGSFLSSIIIVSLIIWTSLSSSNVIVAGGSTSVYPILKDTTQQYQKERKDDILYNALGSAAALVGVKNGAYTFGFLSKSIDDKPSQNKNVNAVDLWNKHKIARFVFARDYIIMVYHLPNGVTVSDNTVNDKLGNHLAFGLFGSKNDDGSEKILKLYNREITWDQAFPGKLKGPKETLESKAVSFTREPGSGTRDFFEKSIICSKDYKFSQTASSNGAMLDGLKQTPGSIGYISFPYVKSVAEDKSLGIAAADNNTTKKPDLPYLIKNDDYDFNPEYPLTRPFTGIINTTDKNADKALGFIAWMLDYRPYDAYIKNPTKNPLKPNQAAYWYIKEGDQPLSKDDVLYVKNNVNKPDGVNDDWKSIDEIIQGYLDNVPGRINI